MGIEPTWDFVEPHAGFEDQERHQVALHLRIGLELPKTKYLRKALIGSSFSVSTALSWPPGLGSSTARPPRHRISAGWANGITSGCASAREHSKRKGNERGRSGPRRHQGSPWLRRGDRQSVVLSCAIPFRPRPGQFFGKNGQCGQSSQCGQCSVPATLLPRRPPRPAAEGKCGEHGQCRLDWVQCASSAAPWHNGGTGTISISVASATAAKSALVS